MDDVRNGLAGPFPNAHKAVRPGQVHRYIYHVHDAYSKYHRLYGRVSFVRDVQGVGFE